MKDALLMGTVQLSILLHSAQTDICAAHGGHFTSTGGTQFGNEDDFIVEVGFFAL